MVNILDEDDVSQNGSGESTGPDYEAILGAPDFATLIRRPRTGVSREYEKKVQSAFKAVALGSINAGRLDDAAAIFWHGPGTATAIGNLAAADDHARKAIDMLTAPDNPWVVTVLTIIPMISQLARNHEPALQAVPGKFRMTRKARAEQRLRRAAEPQEQPRFTIRMFGKSIPVRVKFRLIRFGRLFGPFRSQTHDPSQLVAHVFSDDKLLAELKKAGVEIRVRPVDE